MGKHTVRDTVGPINVDAGASSQQPAGARQPQHREPTLADRTLAAELAALRIPARSHVAVAG